MFVNNVKIFPNIAHLLTKVENQNCLKKRLFLLEELMSGRLESYTSIYTEVALLRTENVTHFDLCIFQILELDIMSSL